MDLESLIPLRGHGLRHSLGVTGHTLILLILQQSLLLQEYLFNLLLLLQDLLLVMLYVFL